MEIRKLIKYYFLLLLCGMFYSCHESNSVESNLDFKRRSITDEAKLSLLVLNDTVIVFSGEYEMNKITYTLLSIKHIESNYELIQLIDNKDTNSFILDGLRVFDSIFDLNNDKKNDFNIKSQTTNGFELYTYLFDSTSNKLSTDPIIFENYVQINLHSFFQINNSFSVYTFSKFHWSGSDIVFDFSYLVDNSTGVPSYSKILDNDTIGLEFSRIESEDLEVINTYCRIKD